MSRRLVAFAWIAAIAAGAVLCAPGSASPECDFAVATMGTAPSLLELELFVRTLARFDPARTLFVAVDAAAHNWLQTQTILPRTVGVPCLDKYSAENRDQLKRRRARRGNATGEDSAWLDLQLEKVTVMRVALGAGHGGVLFADADVIWLARQPAMGPEVLGVSPCLCNRHTERRYGRFNGGMVFARDEAVLDLWERASRKSRYYEQAAIEDLVAAFPHFSLPSPASDLAALYLLKTHSRDGRDHAADLTLGGERNASVLYQGAPLLSAHGHVLPGPNFAKWARPATTRLREVLSRSAIRDDLCATHTSFCGG